MATTEQRRSVAFAEAVMEVQAILFRLQQTLHQQPISFRAHAIMERLMAEALEGMTQVEVEWNRLHISPLPPGSSQAAA